MKRIVLCHIFLLAFFLNNNAQLKLSDFNSNIEIGQQISAFHKYKFHWNKELFIGARIYSDSIVKGKLMFRVGYGIDNYSNDFFLNKQAKRYTQSFTVGVHYKLFNNKYISPVIGLGYFHLKWENYIPYYEYYSLPGLEGNVELWLFPKSRISLGLELTLGYGMATSYHRYNYKNIHYSKEFGGGISKVYLLTLQYKLFQKDKVFFNKKQQ